MSQKINHTRIKNTIKKWVDERISSDLYPVIEEFLIDNIKEIILRAKELMEAGKRVTLFRRDLKLSDRYFDLGRERNFTDSEIKKLIKETIGKNYKIGNGVIETVRGYLTEKLMEKILKAKKVLLHSSDRMLQVKHFKIFIK